MNIRTNEVYVFIILCWMCGEDGMPRAAINTSTILHGLRDLNNSIKTELDEGCVHTSERGKQKLENRKVATARNQHTNWVQRTRSCFLVTSGGYAPRGDAPDPTTIIWRGNTPWGRWSDNDFRTRRFTHDFVIYREFSRKSYFFRCKTSRASFGSFIFSCGGTITRW